jgi:sortase A
MSSLAFFERLFWATAAFCLFFCVLFGLQAHAYRSLAQQSLVPQNFAPQSFGPQTNQPQPHSIDPAHQPLLGRIEVPSLALSAPISGDVDDRSLRLGVGHIRGTAMPGGLGTVGLAGHRDSFFRPLRRIQPGMEVNLTDSTGTFHYLVDSTEIVTPDKVSVLDIAAQPELTLITCFPFNFVGAAPRRFIVHAHLLSAAPDTKLLLP